MHRQRRHGILKNDSHYLNTFNNVRYYIVYRNKKKKEEPDDEKALYAGGQKGGGMWRSGHANPVTPITDNGKHKLSHMWRGGTNISTWHLIDIVSMWEAGLITHHKKYLLFIRKYFMITSEYIMILFINYITFDFL